ncbi:hypothetical protein [Hydrocarboniclastica marina]|uniref:Uncharacterized protein n=1 Tax=Hydrocarboniclastica marina TaxID=2259620 RepID=A0A4P7XKJ2_9ALTE|nr:hypothetical protein [Hydrocarboniclastica marina]MAM00103.1 hypothetical protein [Alteromonadaceae bacterium]QCF27415.1 hypothetical protein soil367_16600 [Hydrocarboniclastica marina]|tara:strand:+ start:1504 stop:1740 length:237 start_codon:yes stop_codon:yes gene_type:complete
MKKRLLSEKDLLRGLNEHTGHADEVFTPLPRELDPLEKLKGSVIKYDRPFDSVWDDWFDDQDVSEESLASRDQPEPKA